MIHPMMVPRAAITYHTSKSDQDLKAMKEEMDEDFQQAITAAKVLAKQPPRIIPCASFPS